MAKDENEEVALGGGIDAEQWEGEEEATDVNSASDYDAWLAEWN